MAAKKPEAEAEAPKKKGKLLIIVSALVVVLGAGGGGAWFFLRSKDAEAHVEEKPKAALFLPLEMFTVNLVPNDGQPEFVQTGLTLKVEEQQTIDQIKERMPLVRDRILMVLSGKRSADLMPVAGKRKLAEEIAAAVQTVIEPPKPAAPKKAKKAAEEDEEAKGGEEKKSDEAKADEEAEGEEKAAKKKAKAVKVAKAPTIEVLFTSFMIQ